MIIIETFTQPYSKRHQPAIVNTKTRYELYTGT